MVSGHDSALVRLYWAGDNLGKMRWILPWNMSLVQDRSIDMLISSPDRYHSTTDAPNYINHKISRCTTFQRNYTVAIDQGQQLVRSYMQVNSTRDCIIAKFTVATYLNVYVYNLLYWCSKSIFTNLRVCSTRNPISVIGMSSLYMLNLYSIVSWHVVAV